MKYTLLILALLLSACGDDEVQPPLPAQVQTDPQLQLLQQQQLLLQQQQQELRQLEAQVQAPIQQQQPQQQYQQQAPVIVQQPQHSGLNDMLLGGLIGHAIAGGGSNNQPSRQVTNVTRNYYQAPRPRSSSVYRRSSSYRH